MICKLCVGGKHAECDGRHECGCPCRGRKFPTPRCGFFSAEAKAAGRGTFIYRLAASGGEVEVCWVDDDPAHGTRWDDVVRVGRVKEFIRVEQRPAEVSDMTAQEVDAYMDRVHDMKLRGLLRPE
jgi:hypothetical protein